MGERIRVDFGKVLWPEMSARFQNYYLYQGFGLDILFVNGSIYGFGFGSACDDLEM